MTLLDSCGMCTRIKQWEDGGDDPLLVARTQTGYVLLFSVQLFPGHTLFVTRDHITELHELGEQRSLHLAEMGMVAEAVWKAFAPPKLNYAYLGNNGPHVHWN